MHVLLDADEDLLSEFLLDAGLPTVGVVGDDEKQKTEGTPQNMDGSGISSSSVFNPGPRYLPTEVS